MIKINDFKQFEEVFNKEGLFCLFFGRQQSPTCLVMEKILNEVCKKRDYKYLYLNVSIQKFYKLIIKYNVSVLPKYVFIKNNKIIQEGVGTESKSSIEKRLRKKEI